MWYVLKLVSEWSHLWFEASVCWEFSGGNNDGKILHSTIYYNDKHINYYCNSYVHRVCIIEV